MSDVAIRVEGLSKLYRLGKRERYRTLRDTLVDTLAAPFRCLRSGAASNGTAETIWALKDVSFEVQRGEVLGIIGSNGAGKSTLLKILSRITDPTEGHVAIRGSVGSLLEVGTGFHPELTGRENIYLNGAILGMRKTEVQRRFDGIVAFAEVDKFIDTPVKHYSSGMYMRLAFGVAARLNPDILLVDEVLAVGDARFQKKCINKMGEVTQEGRTVLFVSHNLTAVATICKKTAWLANGGVVEMGPSPDVISRYLRPETDVRSFDLNRFPNDADFQLLDAYVSQGDSRSGPYDTSLPVEVRLKYLIKRPITGLRVGIDLLTTDGVTLWRSFDDDLSCKQTVLCPPGTYDAVCFLPANHFFPRGYLISLSIGLQANRWITVHELQQLIEFFNVNGVGVAYADERHRAGLLMLGLEWKTTPSAEMLEYSVRQ